MHTWEMTDSEIKHELAKLTGDSPRRRELEAEQADRKQLRQTAIWPMDVIARIAAHYSSRTYHN